MKTEHTISRQTSAERADWYAADEIYQCELMRAYGRNARNARYKLTHTDPGVTAARDAFHAAGAAWHAKIAKVRAEYPAAEAALTDIIKRLMP